MLSESRPRSPSLTLPPLAPRIFPIIYVCSTLRECGPGGSSLKLRLHGVGLNMVRGACVDDTVLLLRSLIFGFM
jgi:hypothetical protein